MWLASCIYLDIVHNEYFMSFWTTDHFNLKKGKLLTLVGSWFLRLQAHLYQEQFKYKGLGITLREVQFGVFFFLPNHVLAQFLHVASDSIENIARQFFFTSFCLFCKKKCMQKCISVLCYFVVVKIGNKRNWLSSTLGIWQFFGCEM